MFHTKIKVFHYNKSTMPFTSQIVSFGSLEIEINKSKLIGSAAQSNYNF